MIAGAIGVMLCCSASSAAAMMGGSEEPKVEPKAEPKAEPKVREPEDPEEILLQLQLTHSSMHKLPANDWGGGNMIFLDRHTLDCW
jgi:hypothetical protein